jgi:predicted DnaQ family exonuclease/DinG family helicase
MPSLFDLLAESSDKDKLKSLRQAAPPKNGPQRSAKEKRTPQSPPSTPSAQSKKTLDYPNFVALDLETTGLNRHSDRIIEVGAVKFVDGKEVAQYSSLVNPGIPIPPLITQLTGITDADVATAPRFEHIVEELLEFIGQQPLCGHQVDFDINFLNEELGLLGKERLDNIPFDTAQLSRLLLMDKPSYSLGQVASYLDVPLHNAHRALDDARASAEVACRLISHILEIPGPIRKMLSRFAPRSILKKLLLDSLNIKDTRSAPPAVVRGKQPQKLPAYGDIEAISLEAVEAVFEPQGSLDTLLSGYAPRLSQTEMANAFTEALNGESMLVAEAGTGTGKSLAYLVPAALFALHNSCRVLLSTYTRNLQDQLATKELPLLQQMTGGQLVFSVLKGRANYLCRNRYARLLNGSLGNLSQRDRAGLLPLIRWVEQTTTGDIEEQRQFNPRWNTKVWNLINADAHNCLGFRCPQHDECFLQQARRRAHSSHVVVINHSLFFSELCADSSFLNHKGPIIFDEAHHLEASGLRTLDVVIDTNRLKYLNELATHLMHLLEKSSSAQPLEAGAKELKKGLKKLRSYCDEFTTDLLGWSRQQQPQTNADFQFAYRESPFGHLGSIAGMGMALNQIQDILVQMQNIVDAPEVTIDDNDLLSELISFSNRTGQLRADLAYLCAAITEDHVFWIEGNHQKGWVKLCGVTLDIAAVLAPVWKEVRGGVLFTSATLSVAGSLDFFCAKVGINPQADTTRTLMLPSPFVQQQSIRLATPTAPNPSDEEYASWCAHAIAQLHLAFEKNILVLFTANAFLAEVEKLLRNHPEVKTTSVLSQDSSGSRNTILEQFKKSRHMILLGSGSFWEGIDAPGESCELVIIPRLPFAVPTEPITQALAAKAEREHGESFCSFSLPEAIIRFRQGAGRLIRTAQDRGALVVLDNRLVTKGYGKSFAKSLDGTFEACADTVELIEHIRSFFDTPTESGKQLCYVPLEDA